MKYKITDLIDIDRIDKLLKSYTKATGLVSALLDLDGTILSQSGWQKICTNFHRIHPETAKNCTKSDTILAGKLEDGNKYNIYKCLNGLIDIAVPITVNGTHIGNLFTGQFFTEPPDEEFFIAQAKNYSFDKKEYLNAVSQVPILTESEIKNKLLFLSQMTELIAELGFAKYERIKTNEELLKSKEKIEESGNYLNNIINYIGDPVFVKDDQSRIILTNNAFCSLFNLSRDQIIGKTLAEEVPLEEQESFLSIDKEVIETGKENINEESLSVIGKQTKIISTRKSQFIDNNGKKYLIGVIHDITERKQAEAKITESESNLSSLVNNTQDSIWSLDRDYNYIIFNRTYAELFLKDHGFEVKKGMNGKKNVSPEMQKFWESIYEPVFAGEKKVFEYTHSFDGSLRYFQTSIYPIYEDGEITGASAISVDISEVKLAQNELIKAKEKAEESDKLKSAFLANMSHEIRTPMNGILGFSSLLKNPNLTGTEQQEYINIIEKSGARMLNIINDIVSISKIEAGLMEVNIQESNINDQIDFIYNLFKPEIEEQNRQIIVNNLLLSNEALIKTDKEKVYAILTNLVKNAIKYSKEGAIEIGTKIKGDNIEFYVKDSGIGIPKERQKAIFERFIQADITDKDAYQGAGLGLSISKAFVNMLGGEIWVKSEIGIGSTFYFTLPYNIQSEKKQILAEKVSPSIEKELPINMLKILIVEDDETSSELIAIYVQKFAKEIIYARTGKEAVEACKKNSGIDILLMDIQMPILNGYEATRQIREFNKDVIIIAQTAFALKGDQEKALAAGCNYFITKPIKADKLKEIIKKCLK